MFERRSKFLLPVLLVTVALALASCGGSGGGQQGERPSGGAQETKSGAGGVETTGGMRGMETTGGMSGMDMGSGKAAPAMLVQNGEYSDERFIDMMVPHHMMAIEQAEVALDNAEHPEIRQLAQQIIDAQQQEIAELKSVKQQEFGTSETPKMMAPESMANMGMTMGKELASAEPFDKAFMDSMMPHHAAAMETASVAYKRTDNPELRRIARGIIDGQAREIGQMIQWRQEWYPEG